MKRAKSPVSDYKISTTDYYQIFISVLMVILGIIISVRSFTDGFRIMSLLVGGGFLALGCYRLNFVIKYFRQRKRWSHR